MNQIPAYRQAGGPDRGRGRQANVKVQMAKANIWIPVAIWHKEWLFQLFLNFER